MSFLNLFFSFSSSKSSEEDDEDSSTFLRFSLLENQCYHCKTRKFIAYENLGMKLIRCAKCGGDIGMTLLLLKNDANWIGILEKKSKLKQLNTDDTIVTQSSESMLSGIPGVFQHRHLFFLLLTVHFSTDVTQ